MGQSKPPPSQPDPRSSAPDPEDLDVAGRAETAGQAVHAGQARVFPCEACGAELEFSIGQQQMKCPYCGHSKLIEFDETVQIVEQDFRKALARLEELHEKGRTDETDNLEVHCAACGGTVMFTGSLTSQNCPWCDAPIQREPIHTATHRIPVDGVLPFFVEKDRARTKLQAWIDSRWFAPNEFRRRGIDGKFDGLYLPFWTYDSLTFSVYEGQRGEDYTVVVGSGKDQRTETHTRWYSVSGKFQRFFDDVLICAADGMPESLINELSPWPMEKLIPFTQQVLAGFFARTYDVKLYAGFDEARERIREELEADTRRRIGGDHQRIDSLKTRHDAITFKHLLLPVWTLAYRFHDKTYRVFVNAATGEVQGERPYSWVKILALVMTIAAILLTIVAIAKR